MDRNATEAGNSIIFPVPFAFAAGSKLLGTRVVSSKEMLDKLFEESLLKLVGDNRKSKDQDFVAVEVEVVAPFVSSCIILFGARASFDVS